MKKFNAWVDSVWTNCLTLFKNLYFKLLLQLIWTGVIMNYAYVCLTMANGWVNLLGILLLFVGCGIMITKIYRTLVRILDNKH